MNSMALKMAGGDEAARKQIGERARLLRFNDNMSEVYDEEDDVPYTPPDMTEQGKRKVRIEHAIGKARALRRGYWPRAEYVNFATKMLNDRLPPRQRPYTCAEVRSVVQNMVNEYRLYEVTAVLVGYLKGQREAGTSVSATIVTDASGHDAEVWEIEGE